MLLDLCRQAAMPVVTVGAAGGRADPTRITVADLTRADYDGLLFQASARCYCYQYQYRNTLKFVVEVLCIMKFFGVPEELRSML